MPLVRGIGAGLGPARKDLFFQDESGAGISRINNWAEVSPTDVVVERIVDYPARVEGMFQPPSISIREAEILVTLKWKGPTRLVRYDLPD